MAYIFHLAIHRRFPQVTIFKASESLAECEKAVFAHDDWKDGRYEEGGPTQLPGSIKTWIDTAFDVKYPVFEIQGIGEDVKQ